MSHLIQSLFACSELFKSFPVLSFKEVEGSQVEGNLKSKHMQMSSSMSFLQKFHIHLTAHRKMVPQQWDREMMLTTV